MGIPSSRYGLVTEVRAMTDAQIILNSAPFVLGFIAIAARGILIDSIRSDSSFAVGPSSCSGNATAIVEAPPGPSMVVVAKNSDPVSHSLVSSETAAEASASPLLSSNTPEASGTARKAPCGSLLGEP